MKTETSNYFDKNLGNDWNDEFFRDKLKSLNQRKQYPINPVVEQELRKILDEIWENRINLTSDFVLKQLSKFTNKNKCLFR